MKRFKLTRYIGYSETAKLQQDLSTAGIETNLTQHNLDIYPDDKEDIMLEICKNHRIDVVEDDEYIDTSEKVVKKT